MFDSLGDRMKSYEKIHDYKMMSRVPVICRIDGIGFSRLCRKIKKPYSPIFLEAMAKTMLAVVQNVSGAVFGYQQSDEITIIIRNDQTLDSEPWYDNRIQKVSTSIVSKATRVFNKHLDNMDEKLDLSGDAEFDGRSFTVPSISEAVNNLIWRQQDCTRNSISATAQAVLGKKFGKKTALKMIHGKSTKDKLELMLNECGIDFEQEFPAAYRMGVGVYKIPIIIPSKDGTESTRKKWTIDWDLPNFVTEKDFIYNLIFSGHDVFRENSITTLKQKDIS